MADDKQREIERDEKHQDQAEIDRTRHEEAELDEALDESFPASDPITPSRIDGPNN
ncbi:hypothetical protein [Jiella mangrovi]|uniref:Uncharacterized protein n=1 Tax=Jiella mangrovi TaxID=2821407 RepID=A0ABS4BGV9_9HYPH|nr:hypothetical protein [Jiella mangrovi]MBP0615985.1 hypothetical protein [Jiella mangrovi]